MGAGNGNGLRVLSGKVVERGNFGAPRVQAKPELSAILLTDKLTEESARWFLDVREIVDELIIFVDTPRADGATHAVARQIATRVVEVAGRGFVEAHLEEMVHACRSEWILRLDSDERLSDDWQSDHWRGLLRSSTHTHYNVPRRWTHPAGGFLQLAPWWPDPQLRLFRNEPARIQFPTVIHEPMLVAGHGGYLRHLAIEHHVLRVLERPEREEKVRRYRELRPECSLGHYYLFEEFSPPVSPLPAAVNGNCAELLAPIPPLTPKECERINIRSSRVPSQVKVNELFWISLAVENSSLHNLSSSGRHPLHISYHWARAESSELVLFDGARTELLPPVATGSHGAFSAMIFAPEQPGVYLLQMTLVQENVRWLEEVHPPIVQEHRIAVIAAAAAPNKQ